MKYPTIDTLDCADKTIFVRVDFNVSFDDDGNVRDDARIRAALPTITELQNKGARLVLASHLGRPKGKPEKKYSLLPVAKHLAALLNVEVIMPDDCVGLPVKKLVSELRDKNVVLLENVRFHLEETENDDKFASQLAELADIYVSDAFGSMHRAHASTVGMVKYFKQRAVGRLVEKEINFLSKVLHEPPKPYVVILGGAKISDKILVIEQLMNVADKIIIGGGMAYTFLMAKGVAVGKSLVEENKISNAKRMLERALNKGIEFILPEDHIIAASFDNEAPYKTVKNGDDWGDWMGMDVGPVTLSKYAAALEGAQTVFWNGPLGVFEMPNFSTGTMEIARKLSEIKALTVVGGGDSLAAIKKSGLSEKFTHLSTGGGASLEYLEGKELPGLKAVL
ncbi:MAG: phosphoglycerate kinase [Deltaproteobacteria bacterium]|nr:phosphoglycerate kinase [Deltaproteobacteria bacterium]